MGIDIDDPTPYLYAAHTSRKDVCDAMSNELSIHIKVIFTRGDSQSWNIDRDMEHTEKGESKHRRDSISKRRPIHGRKV